MLLQRLSLLILVGLTLTACNSDAPDERSDAFQALQSMAYSRAYPGNDIPAAALYASYEKRVNEDKQSTVDREVPPWNTLGPYNIAGRSLCLGFNPQNPRTIYTGTASGGLWRSYNGGRGVSWERIPLGHPVLGVSTIDFAPNDSTTMYIGTGEVYNVETVGTGAAFRPTRGTYGIGILKSTDNGQSWTKSLDWSYAQQRGVWQVRVAPSDRNIVYAATTDGVYKSINEGASWNQVHNVPMAMDLAIHPTNPDIVFVGCGNLSSQNRGLYRTTNGGQNWTKAGSPFPQNFGGKIMLDIHEADPDLIFASVGNSTSSQNGATWLMKSTDGGDNWVVINQTDYSRFQGWFSHDVVIHPADRDKIITIGVSPWLSANGGRSLIQQAVGGSPLGRPPVVGPDGPPNYMHSDVHDVMYYPSDPETVYYAGDGGIYISEDGGQSFASINGGLVTTQFYNGFSVAQDREDYAMGGLQDNGTVLFEDDPAWTRVVGGDGSWTAMNPENHLNHFGSSQYLNITRRLLASNYQNIRPPSLSSSAFIAPYVLAPSNPQRMYAGQSILFRSDENGDNWYTTNGNAPLNDDPIFALDVAPSDEDVVYAATAPVSLRPELFVSVNGGNSFNNITAGLPDRFINDVYVHPENPLEVYVTMGGFGSGHVYRSVDGGGSWEDITSDLPDVPTSAIVVDISNADALYVGNDLGVYVSLDDGQSWEDFNEGFVDATLVMDLKIKTSNRKLYVATHGSGSLERDLLDESVVSAQEVEVADLGLKAWPNPFTKDLNLSLRDGHEMVTLELYSMSGQLLKTKSSTVGVNTLSLEGLEGLSAGAYMLRVVQEGKTQSVVVEKF